MAKETCNSEASLRLCPHSTEREGRAQQAQTWGSGCVRGLEEGKHARNPLHSGTHVAHGLQLRVRDLQQRAFVLLQPER